VSGSAPGQPRGQGGGAAGDGAGAAAGGLDGFAARHFAPGRLYTFVGAGGKSSGMRAVAACLRRAGLRVLMTTTTRVGTEEFAAYPAVEAHTAKALASCLRGSEPLLLVAGAIDVPAGKYGGLPAALLESADIPDDLVVLVEGDGARRMPLKAPRAREPVIPTNTSGVFALMGASAFGRPIDAACCYNSGSVLALLGRADGVFDAASLVSLAADPAGGRKGVLPGMSFHLVVNQGEDVEKRPLAHELLRRLALEHGITGTLLSWREETVYEST
jgi:probable selenium-dependent hydroxylase accessory protein YqeC